MKQLTLGSPPNLKDPRIERRYIQVITWAECFLDPHESRTFSAERLREVFGVATNPVSSYLRSQLLIPTTGYTVGKTSKGYVLSTEGLKRLRRQLVVNNIAVTPEKVSGALDRLLAAHAEELATHSYRYSLKSNRLWHPLQNLRRAQKQQFWARHGLPHNYDIKACAPTLLLQVALYLELPKVSVQAIQAYLDDRKGLRERLAKDLDIEPRAAKQLINSLFNGARLAANSYCSAFALLGSDRSKMELLQNDAEVAQLRSAIKRLWRRVAERSRTHTFSTGSEKWQFYFGLEKMVMDVVRRVLDEQGIKHFDEHDGFRTDRPIDLDQLKARIKSDTPVHFVVDFETGD